MDPYLAEIKLFPFNFVPFGWAECNGAIMQIRQNTALYSLIGNQFGGDGRTTYALPNLSDCAPTGMKFYIAIMGLYPIRE